MSVGAAHFQRSIITTTTIIIIMTPRYRTRQHRQCQREARHSNTSSSCAASRQLLLLLMAIHTVSPQQQQQQQQQQHLKNALYFTGFGLCPGGERDAVLLLCYTRAASVTIDLVSAASLSTINHRRHHHLQK